MPGLSSFKDGHRDDMITVLNIIMVAMVTIVVVESPTWSLQPSCFLSSSALSPLENCNFTSVSFLISGGVQKITHLNSVLIKLRDPPTPLLFWTSYLLDEKTKINVLDPSLIMIMVLTTIMANIKSIITVG